MWKLVEEFSADFNISKTLAEQYLRYFLNKIQQGVSLQGYFSTEIREVPEKSGVTKVLGTEKAWTVPAHKELKIKLSKGYKMLEKK